LLEGLAVHPKLFRGPLVDRDRRLAQGCFMLCVCGLMQTHASTSLVTFPYAVIEWNTWSVKRKRLVCFGRVKPKSKNLDFQSFNRPIFLLRR